MSREERLMKVKILIVLISLIGFISGILGLGQGNTLLNVVSGLSFSIAITSILYITFRL